MLHRKFKRDMVSNTVEDTDNLELARARYEYCLRLYEREQARRENIERKAQFHLSLITIFFGALLLRLDILPEIRRLLGDAPAGSPLVQCVYISAVVIAVSILVSLFGVLQTLRARSYNPEYPANPSVMLFDPGSSYLTEYSESGFLRSVAMTYTLALESDSFTNNQKSNWLAVTSYTLLAAIFAFALFFGSISYLQFVE